MPTPPHPYPRDFFAFFSWLDVKSCVVGYLQGNTTYAFERADCNFRLVDLTVRLQLVKPMYYDGDTTSLLVFAVNNSIVEGK